MGKSGGDDNALLVVAIVAVAVSVIAFFVVSGAFKNIQLAPDADEGIAQINVIENIQIDFTFDTLDFGVGYINPGAGSVVLDTSTGTDDTDWLDSGALVIDIPNEGFIMENIGNVDLDIDLSMDTLTDTWLVPGPSVTSAVLRYQVTNCNTADCSMAGATNDDTIAGCTIGPDLGAFATFQVVDEVAPGDHVCDPLTSANAQDEVRIDLELTIPEDITPTGGIVMNNMVADITTN
jgi:hypothetical protein